MAGYGRPALPPGEVGRIATSRLPSGAWRASGRAGLRTGGTKQIRKNALTEQDAIDAAREVARRLAYAGLEWSPITPIAQCIDERLAETEERVARGIITRQSADRDRWNLEIIRAELGHVAVRDVTAGMLSDTLSALHREGRLADRAERSGEGYSVSVVNRIRALLIDVLDVAVNRDCIPANPAVRLKRRETVRRVLPALSSEQVFVVLRVAAEWERAVPQRTTPLAAFIALGLATSLRRGELLALRACDVGRDPQVVTMKGTMPTTVTVSGTLVEVKTDGRWQTDRQPFTKTKKNRRLWIPDFGAQVLDELLDRSPSHDPERPLFASRRGGWITAQTMRRAWGAMVADYRETLLDAGIDLAPRRFTPHILRRTALTALGADDAELAAEQAGHDDVRTTHAHYIAEYRLPTVDPRAAQLLQERIGAVLAG